MKRLILILAILLGTLVAHSESRLTPKQIKMRGEILTFLTEEGYMPKIKDNQDIRFKKEGKTYYVTFDEKDTMPYYLSIDLYYNYDSKYSKEALKKIIAKLNLYRTVKLICYDSTFTITYQAYYMDIEAVKHCFYVAMKQIASAEEEMTKLITNGGSVSDNDKGNANNTSTLLTYNNMFPVYGFNLGATKSDFASKGYSVKTLDSGAALVYIGENQIWDFNKDGIFEAFSLEEVPDEWVRFGLNKSWSYDKWLSFMKSNGYEISINEGNSPKIVEYNGRKIMKAEFTAKSSSAGLSFDFYFDNGNKNGEGYDTTSTGTLNYINIKRL